MQPVRTNQNCLTSLQDQRIGKNFKMGFFIIRYQAVRQSIIHIGVFCICPRFSLLD